MGQAWCYRGTLKSLPLCLLKYTLHNQCLNKNINDYDASYSLIMTLQQFWQNSLDAFGNRRSFPYLKEFYYLSKQTSYLSLQEVTHPDQMYI